MKTHEKMDIREEQAAMITDCQKRSGLMSDWEREFIRSLHEYHSRGGFLSEKQTDILDRIWNRVTTKG